MSEIAMQPRHDATDLRRLSELGFVPLDWRRARLSSQSRSKSAVSVIYDGSPSPPIVADLLRAISLAGATPQLSREVERSTTTGSRVIQFGGQINATNPTIGVNAALTLPTPAQLRGNAPAKREAWSKLRGFLRG